MKSNHTFWLLGLAFYGIGVVAGLFVILVAAWADMESTSYGFQRLANAGLDGFHCPILMTPAETGTISLDVSNPTDNRLSPSVKTVISTSLLPQEFLETVQLMPGESKRLAWPVSSKNIDLGYFIFAKVLLFAASPLPSREATCGIFIINLPGTGQMLVAIFVALSLIGMGLGLLINRRRTSNEWLVKQMSSMLFLALLVVLGLILSFVGSWILSVIILVVALLLILISLSSLFVVKAR